MRTAKKTGPLPPVRVRKEPPTIEEAVFAAQGLSEDVQQQVEIVAGLMGVSEEEARPHVLSAAVPRRSERLSIARPMVGASGGLRRTVVVERKGFRGGLDKRPLQGSGRWR